MTVKEAISILKNVAFLSTKTSFQGIEEAIDLAIEALKAQEEKRTEERTETHSCDCISRNEKQTLRELMVKYGFKAPDMTVTEFVEDILPSAQP